MSEPNETTPAPSSTGSENSAGASSGAFADTSARATGPGERKPVLPGQAGTSASSPDGSDFREASRAWDSFRDTNSYASNATSGASDRLAAIKDRLAAAQDVVKGKYRVVSDSTDDFVHEHPWSAVAMAAVGGIVIGMVVRR